MRIALITDGVWPLKVGGIQRHSYYFIKYLALSKTFVDVYMPGSEKDSIALTAQYSPELLAYISIIPIKQPAAYKFPGHYFAELYKYSKSVYTALLQSEKVYDIIYIQGLTGAWILKNKGTLNSTCIVSPHGLEMFQQTLSIRSRLEQFLFNPFATAQLKKADYIHSLGGKLTSILLHKGISENRIFECGIGIENDWCNNDIIANNDVRKFAFVGRNERRKGIIELHKAINLLIEQKRPFEFHFIGNIPDTVRIQDKCCIYHGEIKENEAIKNILDNVDFLVLPSCAEGMPTVILEAMARGCAIITTDVGAVCNQVDESNGLFVPFNDIQALKRVMEKAIAMRPDAIDKMKQCAIEKIKTSFLWDDVITQMLTFFETVSKQPVTLHGTHA